MGKTMVAMIAAVILAVAYGVVVWLLLDRFAFAENPKGNWDHALTIFNSVSAIGFAAIGVLLGTTVQQTNVAKAEKEKAVAEKETVAVKAGARRLADVAADANRQGFNDSNRADLSQAIADVRALL